jgi:hypothetical protein
VSQARGSFHSRSVSAERESERVGGVATEDCYCRVEVSRGDAHSGMGFAVFL